MPGYPNMRFVCAAYMDLVEGNYKARPLANENGGPCGPPFCIQAW